MPVDKDFAQADANSVKTGGATETPITQTIVNALVDSEPLADDGETYSTVQAAQDAASGWVFVPPGTFNESVTVDTTNMTLVGSGNLSLIDGGGTGEAILLDASGITVRDVKLQTTSGSGNSCVLESTQSDEFRCYNVKISDSGSRAFRLRNGGVDQLVTGVLMEQADNHFLECDNSRVIATNSVSKQSGTGISYPNATDNILSGVINRNPGDSGIDYGADSAADNCICINNRVIGASAVGIDVEAGTATLLANNRISGSTGTSIDDTGTNTVLDGNLTG